MAYTQISDVNITGIDQIIVYIANEVPIFVPFLLICIYLSIGLIIYFSSRKFSGQGDIFAAFTASGFFTAVLGTIMTFVFGIINIWTLTITILIVIVSFVLLMIKRSRD